jgi:glycosyltransferase involved in cell wall biosynthesis
VLLTVCILMPRRRLEDVVRAIRILTQEGLDVAYLVVGRTSGSETYAESIEAEVRASDLGNHVKIIGEVSEKDLIDYYHACDAFVWAADRDQSWGMAGMEAMAAGRPVIVSRANGLAEILEDGRTALLVTPCSPESIADAVERLIRDRALAHSVASQGQELVRERYSWRKHAEQMLALFDAVVQEP